MVGRRGDFRRVALSCSGPTIQLLNTNVRVARFEEESTSSATAILPAASPIALTDEGDDDEVPAYERSLVPKLVYQPTRDEDTDNDTAIDRLAQPGLPCCADLV